MSIAHWPSLHSESFKGVRTLVTGGAGFIGSHITEALVDLGAHVTVLDDLSGGDTANFDTFKADAGDRLRFVHGSILDAELVGKLTTDCRYVFHQAALGSVPGSVEQPRRYHDVNVTGTVNVLEAARVAGVKRVMFAASAAAYGDSEVVPKLESMEVLPKSPYAANKVSCEALLRAFANSYNIDAVSLRYFNVFGPRQNANSAYAAVIAAFAKALFADQHPRIYGDGEQSRDFIFIDNIVHANLLAARCETDLNGEVINIACGQRITVNELAAQMATMTGRPHLTAEHLDIRAGDVKHSLASIDKAKTLLAYEPVVDFETGLQPTVAWYETALVG